MMSIDTARQIVADTLKASGLRGRGATWRLTGRDVQWIVRIDRLPYGERLAVDVGLDLQVDTAPSRPNDCPVLLHLENMPFAADFPIVAAFDLNSGLEQTARRSELTASCRALGEYLAAHATMSQVRDAFRAGDFHSAFIHKDVRALLEDDIG